MSKVIYGGTEPDLNADDEAALDAAWAEIHKQNAHTAIRMKPAPVVHEASHRGAPESFAEPDLTVDEKEEMIERAKSHANGTSEKKFEMRIIGQQVGTDTLFLVNTGGRMCRTVDLESKKVTEPLDVDLYAKMVGGWGEVTVDSDTRARVIELVKTNPAPHTKQLEIWPQF